MKTMVEIITEFSESIKEKTISDVLDDCIITAENTINPVINVRWFTRLKFTIEEELRKCAIKNNVSSEFLIRTNRVQKTENGFDVKANDGKLLLKVYFPNVFNPGSLIIERFC